VTAGRRGSIREVVAEPAVRVAIGVTMVIMLGFGLIVPTLPLFAKSFGAGRADVGLLNTAFALTRLMFDLVAGPLADRYGERAMATLGSAIVGVSSALAAAAPSFGLLVLFRGLGGAGSSILFAALMSYLLRSVAPDKMARTMSLFFASFLLGSVLGQPLGGLIASILGLASPLWVYAGACLVSAGLTFRFLRRAQAAGPATPPTETTEEVLAESEGPVPTTWNRAREFLSSRPFVTALAANAVLFWVLGAVRFTLVPLFAQEEVGLSELGIGLVLGAAAAAQFSVTWWAGAVADTRGRRAALLPGLLGLLVSIAVMGWAGNSLALGVALAIMGVATGFAGVVPAAIVADVSPRESSGAAVGLFRFAGDVGFVLGPVLAGVVAETAGFRPAFLVTAAPVLLVLLLAFRLPETLRRPQEAT
jgi:MFS family permease